MASWIGTGGSNPGDVKTNGNIGVGDDPSYPLDAVGRSRVRGNVYGGGGFWLSTTASPTANISYMGRGTDSETMVGFYTNGSWKLVVKDDGKVGIYTNNPASGLHIQAQAGGSDMGYITLEELSSAPSAPGTGKAVIYMRNGHLYAKLESSATEHTLA